MISIFAIAVACLGAMPHYTGVVWLHGDGCTPCKQMEPMVNKLIAEGLPIMAVKVTTAQDLADYGAELMPTTQAYHDGKLLGSRVGYIDEAALRQLCKDAVRGTVTPVAAKPGAS